MSDFTEDKRLIAERIVGRTIAKAEWSAGLWLTFDDGSELEVGPDPDGVLDQRLYSPDE